jgi:two-component system phosphate regulon response regulator OmpR
MIRRAGDHRLGQPLAVDLASARGDLLQEKVFGEPALGGHADPGRRPPHQAPAARRKHRQPCRPADSFSPPVLRVLSIWPDLIEERFQSCRGCAAHVEARQLPFQGVSTARADPADARMTPRTRDPHLLVVDDDEGLRELLVRYLNDNGYAAAGVADGEAMKRHLAVRSRWTCCCSTSCCPARTACRSRARWHAGGRRSSCSRRAARRSTASSAWRSAPTTTCPSPSATASCWRAWRPCCGGASRRPTPGPLRRFGPSRSTCKRTALTRNGEEVALSGAEFALLKVLLEHPDRVLSRDTAGRAAARATSARPSIAWSTCA